jgi:hypothetical protein
MITKVSPFLSVSECHSYYDFDGLEPRYWNETDWILTIDVCYDWFVDENISTLMLMTPDGKKYSISQRFPEWSVFVYGEKER